jgi:hypothetical protein
MQAANGCTKPDEIDALMHREGVSRRCALGDVSVRPPSGARWPKAALGRAIRDAVRPVWVGSVSSAPWAAVIGADLTVLTPRRRWLCLQYLGYQSLGPLLEWRLNDRNVPPISLKT